LYRDLPHEKGLFELAQESGRLKWEFSRKQHGKKGAEKVERYLSNSKFTGEQIIAMFQGGTRWGKGS